MKGPGLRARLDARRHWRCPETGRSLHTSGAVAQIRSPFTSREVFMELQETYQQPRVSLSLEDILGHMQVAAEPREPQATPSSSSPESNPSPENQQQEPPASATAEADPPPPDENPAAT